MSGEFLSFSDGFLIDSDSFPMVSRSISMDSQKFLWFSNTFPRYSYGFQLLSNGFMLVCLNIPIDTYQWFANGLSKYSYGFLGTPMVFHCISEVFLWITTAFQWLYVGFPIFRWIPINSNGFLIVFLWVSKYSHRFLRIPSIPMDT